uniref:Platelet derived growth factor subunit B n=1 Tax=Oryzias latipes TaxID=8090 RepID=A0A3P9KH27_ORYLA
MRSWVLLLLLAAILTTLSQLGSAEGDPLPPSLVDLVRNSPISSVDDLKLLLQQETSEIEDEEDKHDTLPDPRHARFVRSLSEAQPAQQAVCKVRTEVMEITRSMLDRRNTNFMLWPPCVEVQRCSGCCNTRQLQCVPVVTSSRYLQVIKIQYINRKAHYEKAIISVEDHVSCRCQTASSDISRFTVQSNPSPLAPPLQQPPPAFHHPLSPPRPAHPPSSKTHTSKADLHRHDDLKHNQQHYNSEERDPVARQWHQGSYTQLVRWSQPRVHHATMHALPGVHQTTTSMNKSWPSEAMGEHRVMGSPPQPGHGSGYDGSKEEGGQPAFNSDVHYPDHASRRLQLLQHQQRQQYQHHQSQYPQDHSYLGAQYQELTTQIRLSSLQSDSASPFSPTQAPSFGWKSSHPPTTHQKDSVTIKKTAQVTHYKQTETEGIIQKEGRAESGSTNSGDSVGAELTNQGKEKDSKMSIEEGRLTEEERRQKLLEIVQKEPDKPSLLHLPHFQQRPKPTTLKTALPTAAPMLASARPAPFRPASPRRRRKHRKRISKAAMRAMIM